MRSFLPLLTVVFATVLSATAVAQDFSDPKYAIWGAPEERNENILNSNFFKEAYDNKDYNSAAHYLQLLIERCPKAQMSLYQRGATLYKHKINRAKSIAEKNMYVDSLLLMYDLRNEHFGSHPKYGTPYILDQKAREYLIYKPNDRNGIRTAFIAAISSAAQNASPETVLAYFSNLCNDYQNTDEVMPDEVIAEYERLAPYFAEGSEGFEFKEQFDAAFGLSGAANCENLEKLFTAKLAAAPDDETIISQAVALMSRANCDSDFYLNLTERYYKLEPSTQTALFLAQAFQAKGEYDKAVLYLSETLATEQDPAERQKVYVRLALIELVANDMRGAALMAREARSLNPEDGVPYYILAQTYAATAASCQDFAGQAAFWAAYDTMAKAVSLLPETSEYLSTAKSSMAQFRQYFPTKEECFFQELKAGDSYTVECGTASGITTTVRLRN